MESENLDGFGGISNENEEIDFNLASLDIDNTNEFDFLNQDNEDDEEEQQEEVVVEQPKKRGRPKKEQSTNPQLQDLDKPMPKQNKAKPQKEEEVYVPQEDEEEVEDDGRTNYAILADALVEDGIFNKYDDQEEIRTADDFKAYVERNVNERLSNMHKRIQMALDAGVSGDNIRAIESSIAQYGNIDDAMIEDEGENGRYLRQNLIYNDYLMRGYSEARAKKEMERCFKEGDDIEYAKDALKTSLERLTNQYKGMIEDANNRRNYEIQQYNNGIKQMYNKVTKDDLLDGLYNFNEKERKAICEIVLPKKDSDSLLGQFIDSNKERYVTVVGSLFYLTDGFKNLSKLAGIFEKRATAKGIEALTKKLKGNTGIKGGKFNYMQQRADDDIDYSNANIVL